LRIPFPERIPLNRVALFAIALFLVQMLEGTALYFSVGCVAFIMIAALAFNTGGGLTRTAGAFVGSYAMMAVILGVAYKAFLGEPAQSNLLDPVTDIKAYVGSIAGMYAAVIVSRRLARKTGLLQNLLNESSMYRASVGCIAFGIVGAFAIALLGEGGAKLQTAFSQLNELVPLGIIIGVIYEIRRSGGIRSINLAIVLGSCYMVVVGGIAGFSKQGLLTPFYCWLLPVSALRFRLSVWQTLSCILALLYVFHYMVPYAQYGRSKVPESPTLSQRLAVAIPLLEHPEETRRLYYEQEGSYEQSTRGLNAYYNTPQGFWERLQMVSVDDKLINLTDQGKEFGLLPIKLAFLNVVPHFIWPDKPTVITGNTYAHEITGQPLAEGDTTTGISFSPTGEAYHLEKWEGVLVIAPLLWCLFFVVFDSLFGDLRATPWGLLALALISFIAPEGALTGMIYLLTFGAEGLAFCALFATWFAPLLAVPILGPDRGRTQHQVAFRPSLTPRIPR
jgi:hypothetical protein